jgi:hypothetical protein
MIMMPGTNNGFPCALLIFNKQHSHSSFFFSSQQQKEEKKNMRGFVFVCILLIGSVLSLQKELSTYRIDLQSVCEVQRKSGSITRIPLDAHIRGPLAQELEEHFRTYNSGLEFKIIGQYVGAATEYGRGTEPNSGWQVTLYVRGPASIELSCPEFLGRWNLTEMRERWHCSPRDRYDDATVYWPFDPLPEDGDQPPLYSNKRSVHDDDLVEQKVVPSTKSYPVGEGGTYEKKQSIRTSLKVCPQPPCQ